MTKEEATIQALRNHIEVLEERLTALEQEPKYCDRNICTSNEYNGIECEECEVTKSQILELEQQEPCEDAVSRQAVIETIDSRIYQIKRDANAINKSYSHLSFAEGVHDGYCRLKCDLRILPSVTPIHRDRTVQDFADKCRECGKQKKGKWIFHEKSVSTGFKDLRECSCCHCYFRWEMPRNSYCQNCGAEMESEE